MANNEFGKYTKAVHSGVEANELTGAIIEPISMSAVYQQSSPGEFRYDYGRSMNPNYYPLEKALIISDAHLGKADHFRKSGIAVPQKVNTTNLERLNQLIHEFEPCRVIFLGDLFHSSLNAAWNDFEYLINGYSDILFELVKGNHDILPQAVYDSSILKIYEDELILGPFLLTHIPREEKTSLYNLAGHIHPGVVMKGKAKQYLKLPCFFFSDWQGIVPGGVECFQNTIIGQHDIFVFEKSLWVIGLRFEHLGAEIDPH